MRWPDPGTLLDAWERGLSEAPQRQVLTIMSAFLPDRSPAEIAALPIGRRDAVLLDIYEAMFGTRLGAMTSCPRCGAELEAEVAVAHIRTGPSPAVGKIRAMTAAEHRLTYRLPTTADLLAMPANSDPAEARKTLLGRCISSARDPNGEPIEPRDLPEPVASALAARMAKLDPQANISLSLACPSCGRAFAELLDVAIFVLRHVNGWATRLLRDVHGLASAYGWSEGEVLALSPVRRGIYLEMAGR